MQSSSIDAAPSTNEPRLDPDVAAYLDLLKANPLPPLHLCTPTEARDRHERAAASIAVPVEAIDHIDDRYCAGVPVRIYRPRSPVGTTIYIHGGGFVTGTTNSYDRVCRIHANRSSTTLIAVDYALAPEAKHPVALNEIMTVLRESAATDDNPIVLAGDSAGAYLVVLAALRARDEGISLGALVMINPVIDAALDTPSSRSRATGYRLETEAMRWYWGHYLPDGISPPRLLESDLSGLPPTLITTAGFDPLHDEGVAFAQRLIAAGVPTRHLDFPGQIHGFLRLGHAIREATPAHVTIGHFIRQHAQGA